MKIVFIIKKILYNYIMKFLIHNYINKNNKINKKYICLRNGGNNICPKMSWSCVNNSKSYIIIMEDPDAPSLFVHLALYIIPNDTCSINTSVNKNTFYFCKNYLNENSYFGPCAPENTGTHRYIFTIYALDNIINFTSNNDKINGSKDFINKIKKGIFNVKILDKKRIIYKYSFKNS